MEDLLITIISVVIIIAIVVAIRYRHRIAEIFWHVLHIIKIGGVSFNIENTYTDTDDAIVFTNAMARASNYIVDDQHTTFEDYIESLPSIDSINCDIVYDWIYNNLLNAKINQDDQYYGMMSKIIGLYINRIIEELPQNELYDKITSTYIRAMDDVVNEVNIGEYQTNKQTIQNMMKSIIDDQNIRNTNT
jgi:hypothetical protein